MSDMYKRRIIRTSICLLTLCCVASAIVTAASRSRPKIIVEHPRFCSSFQEVAPPYPVAVQDVESTENHSDAVPEPDQKLNIDNPYAEIQLTASEKQLLACMAYSEAGNQSFDGQVAVVQVALNRYMHDAFSGSIRDILLAPYQFAVGNHYDPEQMDAVNAALSGHNALDTNTDVVFFSTGKLRYGSYYKTIGDHVFRTYQ